LTVIAHVDMCLVYAVYCNNAVRADALLIIV